MLVAQLKKSGLDVSEAQLRQFETYQEELLKWNGRANLISKKDESRIVERHFVESARLSLLDDFRAPARILDLGTGGGFPGVPLRIICCHLSVTLLDSKRWKVLFLQDLLSKLDLENTDAICERAEDLAQNDSYRHQFDLVVSRAVADLSQLYAWAAPFVRPAGKLIAIKGSRAREETEALRSVCPGLLVEERALPGNTERKHPSVVVIVQDQST